MTQSKMTQNNADVLIVGGGPVDLGNTWFFHAPVPAGTTADNFDFRAYLHESVGAEFEVDFEYIGFWDLPWPTITGQDVFL